MHPTSGERLGPMPSELEADAQLGVDSCPERAIAVLQSAVHAR